MAEVFNIVLPVFGLLAIGYVAAWTGLINDVAADGFSIYVQRVAIPFLVFRAIGLTPAPDIAPAALLLCYFGTIVIVWTIGSLVAKHILKTDGQVSAITGVGGAYSNTVMLGLPLVVTSFGDEGALIFFILFPFHLPLMTLLSAIQIEWSRGENVNFVQTIMNTFRGMAGNPIIVAIIVGALFRASGLTLPESVDTVSKTVADTAIACALVSMGLILRRYGISRGFKPALLMSGLKLLLFPALVWFFASHVAGLDPVTVGVLTIFGASPVGVNTFIFATRYGVGQAEASSAIAISTGMSIFTISAVLIFLGVG